VSVPSRYLLTAALGLGLIQALPGQEPGPLGVAGGQAVPPKAVTSANQQLADTIADQLRHSALLQGYVIDISVQGPNVRLTGALSTQQQKDEAIRVVRGVPGLEKITDSMTLGASAPVMQVQAAMPAVGDPAPLPRPAAPPMAEGGPTTITMPMEPTGMYQVGYNSPYALNTPFMPPYAWPTYAPYNNYSRVAYPTAYPYSSFPFIGPPYPFPKVPLGWRSVKLEWQDGHWWFGKTATCNDWWRIRYW